MATNQGNALAQSDPPVEVAEKDLPPGCKAGGGTCTGVTSVAEVTDVENCKVACGKIPECKSFTQEVLGKKCWLKDREQTEDSPTKPGTKGRYITFYKDFESNRTTLPPFGFKPPGMEEDDEEKRARYGNIIHFIPPLISHHARFNLHSGRVSVRMGLCLV